MKDFFSDLVFLNINELLPHEEVSEEKVSHIMKKIIEHRYSFAPLLIDKKSLIIIDGHHRYNALKNLGYKNIPCISCDYLSEKIIALKESINGSKLDKEYIISKASLGKLLPQKYTFHVFQENVDDPYNHLSKYIKPISIDLSKI